MIKLMDPKQYFPFKSLIYNRHVKFAQIDQNYQKWVNAARTNVESSWKKNINISLKKYNPEHGGNVIQRHYATLTLKIATHLTKYIISQDKKPYPLPNFFDACTIFANRNGSLQAFFSYLEKCLAQSTMNKDRQQTMNIVIFIKLIQGIN